MSFDPDEARMRALIAESYLTTSAGKPHIVVDPGLIGGLVEQLLKAADEVERLQGLNAGYSLETLFQYRSAR